MFWLLKNSYRLTIQISVDEMNLPEKISISIFGCHNLKGENFRFFSYYNVAKYFGINVFDDNH